MDWAAVADVLDEPVPPKGVEHGQTDRARHRGAVPGVTEREPPGAPSDRFEHVVPHEHRADRRVAGSETLRGRDDVGCALCLRRREPAACSPHAGHDLVEAHEEAVTLAPFGEPFPKPERGRAARERCRAHRLGEERRYGLGAGFLERLVERLKGGLA